MSIWFRYNTPYATARRHENPSGRCPGTTRNRGPRNALLPPEGASRKCGVPRKKGPLGLATPQRAVRTSRERQNRVRRQRAIVPGRHLLSPVQKAAGNRRSGATLLRTRLPCQASVKKSRIPFSLQVLEFSEARKQFFGVGVRGCRATTCTGPPAHTVVARGTVELQGNQTFRASSPSTPPSTFARARCTRGRRWPDCSPSS